MNIPGACHEFVCMLNICRWRQYRAKVLEIEIQIFIRFEAITIYEHTFL